MKPAKSAINLLPQDDLRRKPLAKFLKWFLTWGRYVIAVTEIVLILLLIVQFVLNAENENVKKSINGKLDELTGGAVLEQQIRNAQSRLTSIRTIHTKRISYNNFLTYFKSIIPDGVIITSLQLSETKMDISAVANSEEQFGQFIKNLRSDPDKITNLQIPTVTKGTDSKQTKVTFTLSTDLGQKAFSKDKNGL